MLLNLHKTAKTEAMNEGDDWTMEWTKDNYATCCVKIMKTTSFWLSTIFVSLSCYEYIIYEIQFILRYLFMFNRKFKPSMQNSFT